MSLQLASLFQDHAVLQRDQPIPVWGWAAPGARICIMLGDHIAIALAGTGGEWIVRLPALPVGGPHTLVVSIDGSCERIEIRDLLVGEVWLASGQSNMEMRLNSCLPLTEADIASADFSEIRFFTVPTRAHLGPQRTVGGHWQLSTAAVAGTFSAAAFSFARRLHRELGVPIGIVSSSWGGSIIQSWLSRSALAINPEVAPWLARYESRVWTATHWDQMTSPDPDGRVNGTPKDPGNTALALGWHQADFDDSAWSTLQLPGTWQSAGHKHSGVYWFRRMVEIPAAWIGRELQLHFGGIDKQDISYVNGIEVGRTGKDREDTYWNAPRLYTIPASAVSGRTLHIAVRVYSFVYDGGIIGADAAMRVALAGTDDSCPLAGDWRYRCEHNLGLVTESHLMGHGERNSPHMLFDNMLQPLVPYALRGVIWYQGEGNAGQSDIYVRLMRDLILDWRAQWGQADLAFHLVQLPGFQAAREHQPDSHWAHFREAQATALSLPHTGMAVIIDLGEAGDIHPKNKIPVGERLAQSALARTYGANLVPNGPLFSDVTFVGDGTARCRFQDLGPGLSTTDGGAPRLFFIAGEDRVFHSAQARIEGNEVVVSHVCVKQPCAVRYAWADNPEGCNLANHDGQPASPFRSDRW